MVNNAQYWPQVLRKLLDGVVARPDRLKIDCEILPSSIHLVVEPDCQSGDQGRVRGKKGRMIQAIDHIIDLASKNEGQRVQVSVIGGDTNPNKPRAPIEFSPALKWGVEEDQKATLRLAFITDMVLKGTFKIQAYQVADCTTLIIFTRGVDLLEKTLESLNTLMASWGRVHGRRITVEMKMEA